MPVFSWILLLAATGATKSYRLPPEAKIDVGATHDSVKEGRLEPTGFDCTGFTVKEGDVRHQFATLKRITSHDMLEYYDVPNCEVTGTLTVRTKTFHWTSNGDNLLFTDYPDGKDKILGGEIDGPMDNPNPPHDSPYSLPAQARVDVKQKLKREGGWPSSIICSPSVSRAQVRDFFSTSHQISTHDIGRGPEKYSESPCDHLGTVTIGGKAFAWRLNDGHYMQTTYPDGITKFLGEPQE